MNIRRRVVPTLLLAIVALGSGLAARGDEPPLSLRDIGSLRQQRVPPDKIVEKASQQGVSFVVTPGIEKQLSRQGFTPEQIAAIKGDYIAAAKEEAGKANKPDAADKPDKPAAIVPGQGLASGDAERDQILQQVMEITKLSGVSLQPVAAKHVTLWAPKDDRAAFLLDIKKLEAYFEGKCQEPLRSGLDKRTAHVVLLKTRYDYEKWVGAVFDVMPNAFKPPEGPGGAGDLKASMLKWSGIYSRYFIVICMDGQEDAWLHRLVACGVGFMNFVQQVEPQRHDPLSTGFANGAEALVAGSPQVMLFSNSYHNEDRDLGKDPRAWLHLVQERMRTKKESGVRGLLNMDTTNMLLPQYAEAWTLVGVLAKQPEKFGKLLLALREEKDPLQAIEQVYGWDEKKLAAEWHKQVLAQR